MAAERAPMIRLDDGLRPTWLFGSTVHEGCDRGGYYEQAQFAEEYGAPTCIVKLGCWSPVAVQCREARMDEWNWGLSQCWRHLYRMYDAFGRRYEETASPFQWTFTRKDLTTLLAKIENKRLASAA